MGTTPELLDQLAENGKRPRTAIVVAVDEVLFYCGKAINRAGLWKPESHIDRASLPADRNEAARLDAHYSHAVRRDLYG